MKVKTREIGSRWCSVCKKAFPGYRVPESIGPLATATVGAISELLVCADLLRRGWAVFRAVSPACACDLVAIKEETTIRIEVRTGHFGARGDLCYGKTTADKADHVAVVVNGNAVVYMPVHPLVEPIQ